ncbi:tetratricopeptide repeat protein [Xylanibacter oryzae]|uniref:tetratricopeptide repeat protein n=1 Tax=Xylanibacter oryzae TaxID=185293 RepID=UPI00055ED93F|nr:tetratricopeptide repeat protein [Xylanibacter oryzae]
MFIIGCNRTPIEQLLSASEKCIETHPDSSLQVLRHIKYSNINNDKDKALYGLLYSEVAYKLCIHLSSYSMIDYSIKYYKNSHNQKRLANALYYKASIIYERKQQTEATMDAKEAEELALDTNDELLKNKIYDFLCYINSNAKYYDLELEYAKKMLKSSVKLSDNELISRGYALVANAYSSLGQPDKAYLFFKKSLYGIKSFDKNEQAIILGNIGSICFELGKYKESEYYTTKSIELYKTTVDHLTIGKMKFNNGQEKQVIKYWNNGPTINDSEKEIAMYESLVNYYTNKHNYKNAYILSNKLYKIENNIHKKNLRQRVLEIQSKYDKEKSERILYRKIAILLLVIAILVVTLSIFFYYHRKKIKRYIYNIRLFKSKAYRYSTEIDSCYKKINELKNSNNSNGRLVNKLTNKIELSHQSIIDSLRNGYKIYEAIKDKKSIVHYTDADLKCIIDFYKVIKNDIFDTWTEQYHDLRVRQYLFLILEDMEFKDSDIAYILGVSDSTVRSIRSRLKKKKEV